uniref:class I SAM-dependent methyltransferase n=1 Tax=Altererythrobacter segetis TaxID=1104773 RepID=UPI00140AFA0E|nr:class I SAM-dependent methyltransferase [Altererythrobacter segetis]
MATDTLRSLDTHFEFGENWTQFLHYVDEGAIEEAARGLLKLLPRERIEGSSFLDIGCGSGIHSLAAVQLGAKEVVAIDIDPKSVRAAEKQLYYCPNARAERLSIFDADPAVLGTFDIVYSWGVLHHTGAMWDAVEKAAQFVKPGGLFAIALYQKTPMCGAWRVEKRLYTAAPGPLRWLARMLYKAAYIARMVVTGKNPLRTIRAYKTSRGMNFHTDVHDWLGGYPYESATPAEIKAHIEPLGFEPYREFPLPFGIGAFGTGCCEFVFQKIN